MATQDDTKIFDQLADLADCFDVLEDISTRDIIDQQSFSVLFSNLNKQFRVLLDKADSKGLLT